MFHSILVGLDQSEHAKAVLRTAAGLAGICGAKLHILCVVDPAYFLDESDDGHPSADDEIDYPAPALEREGADRVVREAISALRLEGLIVDGNVRAGEPAKQIIATAQTLGADAIVLGHRHLSWLGRLSERSVCHDVLENASQPVLVVP